MTHVTKPAPPTGAVSYGTILVYVLTGALQPTITDLISLGGGTGSIHDRFPMMLPVLASTLGMALVRPVCVQLCGLDFGASVAPGAAPAAAAPAADVTPRSHRQVCGVACGRGVFVRLLMAAMVDLLAGILLMGGLLRVGSAVYAVIYSSNTLWTVSAVW